MGLTLDQIRQQFNIPKSTSDAEVMRIAIEQNITIDFSGGNTSSTTFFGDNSDVSVWGAPAGESTAGGDDLFGDMGLSLGRTETARAAETKAQQTAVSDAQSAQEAEETQQTALEARTETILKQIFGDKEYKIKSKEVKDGKERIETEDGTVIEIPLQEGDDGYDPSKVRSDVQYKIFKNGNVTVKNQDGTESTRKAVNGEEGYVKDGESFDERLARFYEADYKNGEPSLDKKKELAKKYVAQYLAGKTDDVQIGDFKKLLRNTPPDSEMGRALVSLASELNDSVIDAAIEEVYGTRQTDDDVAAVTDELTNGGIIAKLENPETQLRVARTASRHLVTEDNAQSYVTTTQQMHKDNQTQAVQFGYQNIQNDKVRSAFHAGVTDGIAGYDTDNVMDIAQTALDNDDEEHSGAKRMAAHGQDLDSDIQTQFAQLLTSLGIEDVSEILASHAYEYDVTNRDEIIKMLEEQGYDKTKAALEKSRQEYEEKAANAQKEAEAKKAQREAEQKAAEEAKAKKEAEARRAAQSESAAKSSSANSINRSSGAVRTVKSEAFRNSDVKDKEDYLNSLSANDKKEAIQALVENAQGFELDGLMFSGLKNDILNYLVAHPTPKNNNTLRYLQRYLSTDDKQNVSNMQEERQKNGFVSTSVGQNLTSLKSESRISAENTSQQTSEQQKEQKNPFLFNFRINK